MSDALATLSAPWALSSVRALRSAHAWSWQAERAYLREARVQSDAVFVPCEGGLFCLDLSSGEERWRWRGPRVRASALWCGERVVLAQQDSSTIVALDRQSGRALKRLILPSLHRVAQIEPIDASASRLEGSPQRVLLLSERGTVAAIELPSLKLLWSDRGEARGPARFAHRGEALLIAQVNQVRLMEVDTGALRWRHATPRGAREVAFHLDRAVVIDANAQHGRTIVRGLDVERGEIQQEVAFEGYFLGTARSIGEDLWVILERHRRPVIETLCGAELEPGWLLAMQEQARSVAPALTVVPNDEGRRRVLVQTSRSEAVMLDRLSGEVLWRDEQEQLMRAPGGALAAPGVCLYVDGSSLWLRRTDSGEVIYRFAQLIDEPSALLGAGHELDVILGESPFYEGASSLTRLRFTSTLRLAYDRRRDG